MSASRPIVDQVDLVDAIAQEQIGVFLQPLVELRTGDVTRFEALARWVHPTAGTIMPGDFIPLAAHSGLMTPLTLLVLRKSAAVIAELRATRAEFAIAVNLGLETLLWTGFEGMVRRILEAQDCPPSALGLEITEDAVMTDPEGVRSTLRPLRADGLRVYLDDFGAGYSSLGRIAELELDAVKIDRQFVCGVANDHRREAVVNAALILSHDLGLEVVAEGIEDRATWERMLALGCDAAQGYHIARPMPPADVPDWLDAWAAGLALIRRPSLDGRRLAGTRNVVPWTLRGGVLVVDDEPAILEVCRGILEDEGFTVMTAENGAEALRLVARTRPEVVLLDMRMPTLDGEGFVSALRLQQIDVPIVVMTAADDARVWARRLKAAAFVGKPFKESSLIEVVGRFARPVRRARVATG